MDSPFKVGDVVTQREGSMRMKVSAVDKTDGRVRCTWIRGPAKHSQSFAVSELVMSIAKAPTKAALKAAAKAAAAKPQ